MNLLKFYELKGHDVYEFCYEKEIHSSDYFWILGIFRIF